MPVNFFIGIVAFYLCYDALCSSVVFCLSSEVFNLTSVMVFYFLPSLVSDALNFFVVVVAEFEDKDVTFLVNTCGEFVRVIRDCCIS